MKRVISLCAVMLLFVAATVYAQSTMDTANEKAVKITQGPTIADNSGTTATLTWTTDRQAANHVKYRRAGSNDQWKSAYHSGGGTQHSLQLTGLTPGQTYEYQILTQDGDVRTTGQFQAGGGNGTTPAATTNTPATPTSTPANVSSGDKVAIYRSLGPNGVHTFSTSPTAANGFHDEGVTGYLLNNQKPGTVPVYRLTNAQGDTLLTTSDSERASAAGLGYRDEGVMGYVASTQWGGTTPLYRVVTPQGQHFYTASASENAQVLQQGNKDEGVIGYIWTQQ
jgi:hypothetical protein